LSTIAETRLEPARWQSAPILGVTIRSAAPDDCIAELDQAVVRQPVCLGFVNINTAYLIARDQAYQDALQRFTLLNDGVGLDLVSLVLHGWRFAHNLNGTDFVPLYLRSTRHTFRVFLLGGRPGIAERAADVLRRSAPQHDYVGAQHGYFAAHESDAVIERIRQAKPDVLIVALGNPAQEKWIASNIDVVGARLGIGVGALLDFLTGTVPRAPLWMRNAKLEWLYRLMQEPRRLSMRYLVYAPAVLVRAISMSERWPLRRRPSAQRDRT